MIISVREDVQLRPLRLDEAEMMYNAVDSNREYLRRWLPWVDATVSPDDSLAVLESWENELREGSDIVLGIFVNGKYSGNIGLHNINKTNKSAMIGYWMCADAQGNGIMTDSARALINYTYSELGLNRIFILCAVENEKSRAIPRRLGFIEEGTLIGAEWLYDHFEDLVSYGMIRKMWEA